MPKVIYISLVKFLSTLSLRRATDNVVTGSRRYNYFYPRSPCGERPAVLAKHGEQLKFLSTLSLRRATVKFSVLGSVK